MYAQSIYNLGPDGGGESQASASAAAGAVSKMDKDSVSALTAVAGLKDELRDHNKKIETLSDGVNKLVKGSVQKKSTKRLAIFLNKALDK